MNHRKRRLELVKRTGKPHFYGNPSTRWYVIQPGDKKSGRANPYLYLWPRRGRQ